MEALANSAYQTQSAVLFIIFNRPDTTERVFARIREARPPRLYIAADGPRPQKPGEDALCRQTRTIAAKVDWPCEVKTLFRDVNLGCKEAVSSAVTWFFNNEEEGIVLEDDCLPNNDFFRFCDVMLERYRHDTRIRHIGGANLQQGNKRGEASYYYSNMTHVWGWAGWRRVWKDYDKELSPYHVTDVRAQLETIFDDSFAIDTWMEIFIKIKAGEIDTWDYQYGFLNFFNNSLSVIPNYNLISNIGFGENSTHTTDVGNPNANIPLQEFGDITHPLYVLPQKQADYYTLSHDFNLDYRWRRHNKTKRKLKRWVQGLFK
ncbi:nucleotide-diphospho-sugar transferase [Mucilaginibacter lutimaris]|uniref:Nucleotide-diphospho-sugar transferase n=1 Tax=Mucilaginibacter lutimaris TaxID=931629 RepID=A0ABW2ZAA8_9SPHI